MSKVCDICGKGPKAGQNRSHSLRATKRRFMPNLQPKKVAGVKVRVCASCLRNLSKTKAVKAT